MRIALLHRPCDDRVKRVKRLRDAGHTVRVVAVDGVESLKPFQKSPPDAIVIDLDRNPSEGQAVATWLRQRKATRSVPLVFAGGAADKLPKVKKLLPDATYTTWRGILGAVKKAVASAPSNPAVPGTMAGYSGTPLPKKLGIKPESIVLTIGAPRDFAKTLGPLPPAAKVTARARSADLVLLFAKSQAALVKGLPVARRAMGKDATVWMIWPKKASGVATDLSEGFVREYGFARDLVDFKICAVDEMWSGLRFARRKKR